MSSTRKSRRVHARAATLALAALAAVGGCSSVPEAQPEEYSTAPLAIDEAMQRRDWPRVAAEFQAPGVEAGVTRFPYQPQTEGNDAGRAIFGNERANAVLDPFYFVAQAIALPFTYFVDPPFTKVNHRGVVYEPTYTAMPVLPPDQEPSEHRAGHAAPVVPAPEETAPVTPDAAEASEQPEAPEEAPLEIRPEEMPGETGTPGADGGAAPTAVDPAPESADITEPEETTTEPEMEPAPEPEPVPEATEPAPEEPAPATEEDDNK